MSLTVPWNAMWTEELKYEVRPCRWASNQLALWSPHKPGEGRPIFAKPHMVRQRKSIALFLCTICGEHTPQNDRWWFRLGRFTEGRFMTTESPVHRKCADLAAELCPHLQSHDHVKNLSRFPNGYQVMAAIIGGPLTENDFGVKINGRKIIGHLKFTWPSELFL